MTGHGSPSAGDATRAMFQISLPNLIVAYLVGSIPFGVLIGLSGVILLAYIIAIPANEIIIPTVLMLTVLWLMTVTTTWLGSR